VVGVSIRRATPEDSDALAKVAKATFALACPPGTTEDNIELFIKTNLSGAVFAGYLYSPDHRIWLAVRDERAVGYAVSVHQDPTDPVIRSVVTGSPTAELSKIYVQSSEHGGGVAQDLLDVVLAEARDSGALSVWLGVNQLNARANRFYEKNGFEKVGTRSFLVGTNLEEDFVREKSLVTD
jgi:ribosomal protein S18 acetylase RimI-like enzyme